MIRSQFGAARLGGEPPFDTIHFRAYYEATPTGSDLERLSGVIQADTDAGPKPIVLILPGINVPIDSYGWLASRLASDGYIAVTMGAVADVFGGHIGLTPGLDFAAVTPDGYGTRPTASGVQPVLDALATMNASGPLTGAIDLTRLILFGHSAGGTIALQSADTRYFPALMAVAVYGAHTMASTVLGYPEDTILAVPDSVPVLLMAGDHDGVMTASRDRYGTAEHHDPVTRTFDEALSRMKGDSYLVIFEDANHLSICDPHDATSARGFLDTHAPTNPTATRASIADVTSAFLESVLGDRGNQQLQRNLNQPTVNRWRSR